MNIKNILFNRASHAGDHKRQRGIALLFTLGILSVLLVITLLFSMQSSLNHKIA